MDESWRMRMGASSSEADHLQPEDFKDVFGGPPRSVMARKLSMDFGSYSSDWFYEEVFKASDADNARRPVTGGDGHSLPEFFIPEQRRSDDQKKKKKKKAKSWMSKSKSTSSSVLSFEDEDVPLSSFTSRLRPINVPYRWSSTSNMGKCKDKKQDLPTFGYSDSKASEDSIQQLERNERTLNSFIFGFPKPSVSTPEINIMSDYHFRSQSPASAISSHHHHHHHQAHESQNMSKNFSYEDSILYQEETAEVDQDEGDDDVMDSGYVIELNSLSTEANNSEAIDIDEAIAWAKEQFQSLS